MLSNKLLCFIGISVLYSSGAMAKTMPENLDLNSKIQTYENIHHQMDFINNILDNQFITQQLHYSDFYNDYDDTGWNGFITPYKGHSHDNHNGLTSDSSGVFLGGNYRVDKNHTYGFHAGYSVDNGTGNILNMNTKNKMEFLGADTTYYLGQSWFIRGQLTGYLNQNNQNYRTKTCNTCSYSNVSPNSMGLFGEVNADYIMQQDATGIIVPEIGLSWLYNTNNHYNMAWHPYDSSNPQTYNASVNHTMSDALYAKAGIKWIGNYSIFESDKDKIQPILGAGVQQLLLAGDIRSGQNVEGIGNVTSVGSENHTLLNFEAGVNWIHQDILLGIEYNGNYNTSYNDNVAWLNLGYNF